MQKTPILAKNLAEFLKNAGMRHVWVIGDILLDQYIEGDIERLSPEAPVQVVNVSKEFSRLGGAANVANGLAAFGIKVTLAGIIGSDSAGENLLELCRKHGIKTCGILAIKDRPTIRKLRVISRSQQMIRLDWEQTHAIDKQSENEILRALDKAEPPDAVLLSDYAKGVLTDSLIQALISRGAKHGAAVAVDPKPRRLERYRGATVITPNLKEFQAALDRNIDPWDDQAMKSAAGRLCKNAGIKAMLVTMGKAGMAVWTAEGGLHRIEATAREVYDVTGAGDTVMSALAMALANGADLHTAAIISNAAAGIAVGKAGTAVVEPAELMEALSPHAEDKILDSMMLEERLRLWRIQQKKIVFTNGCFDLLHAGHLHILNQAASFGDVLMVGINTDDSIRRINKGPDRPLIPQQERASIVAALDCVNAVILFDEDTPVELIRKIKPDVLVKGADYTIDQVVGKEVVEAYGGQVRLVDLLPDKSTSSLIRRIRGNYRTE
ncbi:MAG: D-glycero-beta-D-manno-heptose-7-phosphate kinase [Desulfobacterales bacterium]|nr:D-glycero-beta-D-manno-heptose-7-phosphate kinase [Desulfobacterales bacterium]